jgi:hypothetical protein
MLLNFFLASLGFIATLSAFGGETWTKGDATLSSRITKRGYISLVCLFSALVLGFVKEFNQHQADELSRILAKELSLQNTKKQEKIESLILQSQQAQTENNEHITRIAVLQAELQKQLSNRSILTESTFSQNHVALEIKNDTRVSDFNLEVYSRYGVDVNFEQTPDGNGVTNAYKSISRKGSPIVVLSQHQDSLFYISSGQLRQLNTDYQEKLSSLLPEASSISIVQFVCVKATYSDQYGGNYARNFRIAITDSSDLGNIQENIHESKYLYDQCYQAHLDFEKRYHFRVTNMASSDLPTIAAEMIKNNL